MSRKKHKKQKQIHGEQLIKSDRSVVVGAEMVEIKTKEAIDVFVREFGFMPPVPEEIKKAMIQWRKTVIRHRTGDERHTQSEFEATKLVAQWGVDTFRRARHQEPQLIDWNSKAKHADIGLP